MWGVVNTRRHWIYAVTFTRRESIQQWLAGSTLTWQEYRKDGWRCVKLSISYDKP